MSNVYGLIGFPLEHSFSPAYFKKKFDAEGINAEYQLFPLEAIVDIRELLQHTQLSGLNVTIPYKEAVIPYLDEVAEEAAAVQAVNCIRFVKGKSIGYNTDVIGFEQSLKPLLQPDMNKAIVLGTGGAAKAVMHVLRKLGIDTKIVSRTKTNETITYDELTDKMHIDSKLIINTTPLGMHPKVDVSPAINYNCISSEHLLYDLIYNPTETKFLQQGKQQGAVVKNGLEMLELQAEASWEIWNL